MASNEWLHGEYEVISSKADEDAFQRFPAYVSLEEVLYAQRLRLQIREPYERRPAFWLGGVVDQRRAFFNERRLGAGPTLAHR